jgi:hypothetical protein
VVPLLTLLFQPATTRVMVMFISITITGNTTGQAR